MIPLLTSARRIVLKVGSALVAGAGGAQAGWLAAVATDLTAAQARGQRIVIVSSGAVALGRAVLGMQGPLALDAKQACAAAGQARLVQAWEAAFAPHGIPVAQILLTPDDTERRRRWLNARATFDVLLSHGAIPVVNENDTVATEELRYGDNDRLAARVAQLIGAELLILLSDIDGLYARDPRSDPTAPHIPLVAAITPEIEAMAGGANAKAGVGTGGMRTKLEAAKIAAAAGCVTVITLGQPPGPLRHLREGGRATFFAAAAEPKAAYKAWIAGSVTPAGSVKLDAGAQAAVLAGKSLLPAGVTAIAGGFEKGDTVRLLTAEGREIGRGLVRYDAADAAKLAGRHSREIEQLLGYSAGPVLVHADDLALT